MTWGSQGGKIRGISGKKLKEKAVRKKSHVEIYLLWQREEGSMDSMRSEYGNRKKNKETVILVKKGKKVIMTEASRPNTRRCQINESQVKRTGTRGFAPKGVTYNNKGRCWKVCLVANLLMQQLDCMQAALSNPTWKGLETP